MVLPTLGPGLKNNTECNEKSLKISPNISDIAEKYFSLIICAIELCSDGVPLTAELAKESKAKRSYE
jgi:hypothetical protein